LSALPEGIRSLTIPGVTVPVPSGSCNDPRHARRVGVALDHRRLDVYRFALQCLAAIDEIVEGMPPGRAHLKDQLDRAATSIVLHLAEGAGEFSPRDKARFYRVARRSAVESAAILDIVAQRRHAPLDKLARTQQLLVAIVSMLVRLVANRAGARARARARAGNRATFRWLPTQAALSGSLSKPPTSGGGFVRGALGYEQPIELPQFRHL
jgi:four helix bundle protein